MFGKCSEAGKELWIGQRRGRGFEVAKVRGERDFGFCAGDGFGCTGV